MFIPDWMQQQHNAFLLVALLLTLWLWLLVTRRQDEENKFFRRAPLTIEELGRAIFSACLSKDFMVYRSLFVNAKEAHDKLGHVAEQFLEQRSQAVLKESFENLCAKIQIGFIFRGSIDEMGILSIKVEPTTRIEMLLPIGTMTLVGNVYRLLLPNELVV